MMKRIVFKSFAIAVDHYVSFKSYGEFKDVQSFVFSDLKKVRSKRITSNQRRGQKSRKISVHGATWKVLIVC